jgi:hypothetical protein
MEDQRPNITDRAVNMVEQMQDQAPSSTTLKLTGNISHD